MSRINEGAQRRCNTRTSIIVSIINHQSTKTSSIHDSIPRPDNRDVITPHAQSAATSTTAPSSKHICSICMHTGTHPPNDPHHNLCAPHKPPSYEPQVQPPYVELLILPPDKYKVTHANSRSHLPIHHDATCILPAFAHPAVNTHRYTL